MFSVVGLFAFLLKRQLIDLQVTNVCTPERQPKSHSVPVKTQWFVELTLFKMLTNFYKEVSGKKPAW